jgi:hypothetical protein
VSEVTQLAVARLRSRRQEKGLSIRALAQRIGVSPSLVSQIETGQHRRGGAVGRARGAPPPRTIGDDPVTAVWTIIGHSGDQRDS